MADCEIVHTNNDGSKIIRSSILELLKIPIWKGNRIIDMTHVENIIKSVEDVTILDSGYKVIVYNEVDAGGNLVTQRYIVDGQHRLEAIRKIFEKTLCDDFIITYTEKSVDDESEAIEYFNKINNTRPLKIDEDPHLVANKFLDALSKHFNTKKNKFIRITTTRKPYIYSPDLRVKLEKKAGVLQYIKVDKFIQKVNEWNKKRLAEIELELALGTSKKDSSIKESALKVGFVLGIDVTFPWLNDIVSE
jgi:hypothetical protein